MRKTALRLAKSEASIGVAELARYAEGWLLDGEIRQHSKSTLAIRRLLVEKLLWFLRQREYAVCGTLELRQFLAYVGNGHQEAGGRWGNQQMTKPVRPRTVHTYHGHLRTLFRWLIQEEAVEVSPMEAIKAPVARDDQIQPFTQEQIASLLQAAKRSHHTCRDEATSSHCRVCARGIACCPATRTSASASTFVLTAEPPSIGLLL